MNTLPKESEFRIERFPLQLLNSRATVFVIAMVALYLRLAFVLSHPRVWAEDGLLFWHNISHGWRGLTIPMAGYYSFFPRLVGFAGGFFQPAAAPVIFALVPLFVSALVLWLATSPRFEMPGRLFLVLAIVTVPAGSEVFMSTTNLQWILPVGAFIILFMSASRSRWVLFGEAIFLMVTSVTGPFSLFLAPLFVLRLIEVRHDAPARRRLMILGPLVMLGALTEAYCLIQNRSIAGYNNLPTADYPWFLWINLPLYRTTEIFGSAVQWMFKGRHGLVLSLGAGIFIFWNAVRSPYRTQKISMVFLGFIILLAGLVKYRDDLNTMIWAGERYFYIGSVFMVWFVCCAISEKSWRFVGLMLVGILEVVSLRQAFNTKRTDVDLEWATWIPQISSGLPVSIPITPPGWYLNLPANQKGGPLAHYLPWLGQTLGNLVESKDSIFCRGEVVNISAINEFNEKKIRWKATGWAWNTAKNIPVALVVLVDAEDRVTGFGFPGFRPTIEAAAHSGWVGIFPAPAKTLVRAYAILDEGRNACPLANETLVTAL